MINMSVKKHIEVDFTAEQWDLFTHKYSYQEVKKVADDLNRCLEQEYNAGKSKMNVAMQVGNMMRSYSKYGANDSEPHWFLERVLNELYGA